LVRAFRAGASRTILPPVSKDPRSARVCQRWSNNGHSTEGLWYYFGAFDFHHHWLRHEMIKLLQTAFYDLICTIRILFHETMGAVFLVIGIVITLNGYKQVRRYIDFGEISYFTLISTFTFGVLMLGYGIHSFYLARKTK
jgi:hypothetical protein